MNLLPKQHEQFAQEGFWDDFFKSRGDKAFDWYGEYAELCSVIHKYIKPNDAVLMVGCGNSKLGEDLYDLSYHDIYNIDISETVIKHMKQRNAKKRSRMAFTRMDATQMTFDDEHFKAAIDKGTLDALLPDLSHASIAKSMLDDVWRVVKLMGVYIIVSLAQDHVVKSLVEAFKDRPCIFRAHKLPKCSDETNFMMPVFAFVITKLKQMPGMKTIWESSLLEDKNTRHSSSEEMIMSIKECQYYAMLQNRLSKGYMLGDGEQPCATLYSADNPLTPRYTIHVVDSGKQSTNRFAVFIAPQGKEKDWMFSTDEGRLSLSSSVDFQRLLVVTLSRGHIYKDIEEVKTELSSKVMELAPTGTLEKNAPFLSMAEGIGIRNVVYQTDSSLHGEVYIEDVNTDAHTTLRHTFCASQTSMKPFSSAKVISKKSKKTTVKSVDRSELCSSAERAMATLVCFCELVNGALANILIIGLKCGTLATFISQYIRGVAVKNVECVETDPVLIDISKTFYYLDEGVTVTQADTYISTLKQLPQQGYGCIIVNDAGTDILEDCLPLLADRGLFIVAALSDKMSELVAILKNTFTYTGLVEFSEGSVIVGSNKELDMKEKRFKKNLYKVNEKIGTQKSGERVKEFELGGELSKMVLSDTKP